jgi:hypothetical protein
MVPGSARRDDEPATGFETPRAAGLRPDIAANRAFRPELAMRLTTMHVQPSLACSAPRHGSGQ